MKSVKRSSLYAFIALLLLVVGFTFPSIAFYKVPQKIAAGQTDSIPSYVYPLWNLYQTGRYVSPYTPKGAERDLKKMIERKGEVGMMSLPIWYVALEAPNYPKTAFPEGIPVWFHVDGFSGDLWFFAIYLAIALRLWPQEMPFTGIHWGFLSVVLCSVAGFLCHSPQSSLADYYRQIHLYFLLGRKGSELDDSASQRAIYDSLPRKGAFWAHKFYYNYANYCRSQERRTPAFQAFFRCVRAKYPDASAMPGQLRDDFRRGSLPLMKYANLLTFNSRAILIYATCLLDVPYVYPLVEIVVFTVIYRRMRSRHEELCLGLSRKYC